MWRLLGARDFACLWWAGLISLAGNWLLFAALPLHVYAQTGSTLATAGMVAAELIPGIVVSSFAGVLVDRWDRRRVLVAASLVQACVVALLVLPGVGAWWGTVLAVAAGLSVATCFAGPAESALLPRLVVDDDLVPANALNALNNRLARLTGLPAGALLYASSGLTVVVIVDVLTFVAAAGLLATMRSDGRHGGEEITTVTEAWQGFWREWAEGLRLVRRDGVLLTLFAVLGLMTFGGTMLDPLDVAWVRDVLDQDPEVYGLLLTTHAVGGVIGTLLVGSLWKDAAPRMLMGWGSLAAGVLLLVKFHVPWVTVVFGLTALNGITSVASAVGVETLVQRTVPDRHRGRVFGALGSSAGALSLAGAIVAGLLGEVVGIVPALTLASLLVLLAGVVVLRAYRHRPVAALTPEADMA